jgi:hypothetical protein
MTPGRALMTSERQRTSHFSGWATKIASILQQSRFASLKR